MGLAPVILSPTRHLRFLSTTHTSQSRALDQTCSLPLINHCHYYPWYRNLEPGQVEDSEFHSDPASYNVNV